MFAAIGSYLLELGMDVSRDKIKDSIQEKQVRERLDDFIQRQSKYNFSCSVEEEIDFGALTDYLRTDLIEDVRVRLRGTKLERRSAHNRIMSKVRYFAQAKTKLGEKRAMDMTTKALEILRLYYRAKVNAELLFIAAEITDTVIENVENQLIGQTETLVDEIGRQRELGVSAITEALQFSPERVVAEGLRMVQDGDVTALENLATSFTKTMSTEHTLFPHYGYEFRLHKGIQKLTSVPLSIEAKKQYPPKFKCVGTVQVGDKYAKEITPGLIDYANRHQLPLVLNITQAQKLLGSRPDPVQYEAEEWVGKTLTVPPTPFREAFPCTISINDTVEFDYVLFRTQEILDDGTVIVSNKEQLHTPFSFTMKADLDTKRLTFTISLNDASNADTLKYVRFMKSVENGSVISIKSLESQEDLARGKLDDFHYDHGFDDIDEEIHFWEMVVALENHFRTTIGVPVEIYESQYDLLQYLYRLIDGHSNTVTWTTLLLRIDLTEKLKSDIANWGDIPFSLAYVGTLEATLWGDKYEIPIIRRYLCVKPRDLEKLKRKAEILDVGEEICLDFIPGNGDQGMWEDVIYQDSVDEFSEDIQLFP